MQCLESISYGMARLCFIVPQPSQFLLRLHVRIDRCTKKVVTLELNISGIKYATVTHKVLLDAAFFFVLSNNNNIIIF